MVVQKVTGRAKNQIQVSWIIISCFKHKTSWCWVFFLTYLLLLEQSYLSELLCRIPPECGSWPSCPTSTPYQLQMKYSARKQVCSCINPYRCSTGFSNGFKWRTRAKDLSCKITFEALYVYNATEINSDTHSDLFTPLTLAWIQVSFDGVNGTAKVQKMHIYIYIYI